MLITKQVGSMWSVVEVLPNGKTITHASNILTKELAEDARLAIESQLN